MDRLAEFFIQFVNTPWAPVLLTVHSFLESSFLPGAHDFFLVAVCVFKPEWAFFFAFFSTIGSTCGGAFGYSLGKFGGRPILEKFTHKQIVDTVEKSYKKYGIWAVAVAGFTPVPFKLFAICSGIFEINFRKFVIVSFFARGARFCSVSALLYFVGPHIKDYIITYFNIFSIVIITVSIIFFIGLAWLKRRLNRAS
ncbi:YqaA family protein [Fibrobacterota bacterium]